jgi:hypothetical protein
MHWAHGVTPNGRTHAVAELRDGLKGFSLTFLQL